MTDWKVGQFSIADHSVKWVNFRLPLTPMTLWPYLTLWPYWNRPVSQTLQRMKSMIMQSAGQPAPTGHLVW